MLDSYAGVQIFQSTEAVRRWTEKRIRFEDFEWQGRKDWRSKIVEVECTEPCAYQMGNKIVMHPILYRQLRADKSLNDRSYGDKAVEAEGGGRVFPSDFGSYILWPKRKSALVDWTVTS